MGNLRYKNGAKRRELRRYFKHKGEPCALCGKPIDYSLPAGHPMSFEIDEIVPVSKGGDPFSVSQVYRNDIINHYDSAVEHLSALLKYMATGKTSSDSLVKEIDKEVDEINHNAEKRGIMATVNDLIRDEKRDLEKRLEARHKLEIEQIEQKHSNEIEQMKQARKDEVKQIEQKHSNEVAQIKKDYNKKVEELEKQLA